MTEVPQSGDSSSGPGWSRRVARSVESWSPTPSGSGTTPPCPSHSSCWAVPSSSCCRSRWSTAGAEDGDPAAEPRRTSSSRRGPARRGGPVRRRPGPARARGPARQPGDTGEHPPDHVLAGRVGRRATLGRRARRLDRPGEPVRRDRPRRGSPAVPARSCWAARSRWPGRPARAWWISAGVYALVVVGELDRQRGRDAAPGDRGRRWSRTPWSAPTGGTPRRCGRLDQPRRDVHRPLRHLGAAGVVAVPLAGPAGLRAAASTCRSRRRAGRVVGVLLLLVSVSFDGLLSTPQWGRLAGGLPGRLAPGTQRVRGLRHRRPSPR